MSPIPSPFTGKSHCIVVSSLLSNTNTTRPSSPNRPLGENTVATRLKVAAKRLGLGDVTGHGLRRLCCTTLHNADGVSSKEVIDTMRHTSISTSNAYTERNMDSESAKLRAQGFRPPNNKKG